MNDLKSDIYNLSTSVPSLDICNSLKRSLSVLSRSLPIDGIYINYFDRASRCIWPIAYANEAKAKLQCNRIPLTSFLCRLLSSPDRPLSVVLDNIQSEPVTALVLGQYLPDAKSVIMVRLIIDNVHCGVVGFYSKNEASFTAEHARLLEKLHKNFAIVTALELSRRRLLNENNKSEFGLLDVQHLVVGSTGGLYGVMEQVKDVALVNCTVLILGESGTGKEVIANAIHQLGGVNSCLVSVNCGAIPEQLIDSILFGHEKGAFTGAETSHKGYFEQADGGTLFLDEIGELPLQAQVKLLRVLQTRKLTRVGGTKEIPVDFRLITATHRDLAMMVQQGSFREDLWYRINLFPIVVPALRERVQDIPALADYFLNSAIRRLTDGADLSLTESHLKMLISYAWPGNVRELQNVIDRAVISARSGEFNLLLPHSNRGYEQNNSKILASSDNTLDEVVPLDTMVSGYLEQVLMLCGGKIQGKDGAASKLQVNPSTLRSKLKKLGII